MYEIWCIHFFGNVLKADKNIKGYKRKQSRGYSISMCISLAHNLAFCLTHSTNMISKLKEALFVHCLKHSVYKEWMTTKV